MRPLVGQLSLPRIMPSIPVKVIWHGVSSSPTPVRVVEDHYLVPHIMSSIPVKVIWHGVSSSPTPVWVVEDL